MRRVRHEPKLTLVPARRDIVARIDRLPNYARIALASIRIFNGTAALLAPESVARRLGLDDEQSRGALYALRLFGVRTIVIGADLLRRDPAVRARAVRSALVIHASDVAAAAIAGAGRHLPPPAARAATTISAVNVLLALLARRARSRRY